MKRIMLQCDIESIWNCTKGNYEKRIQARVEKMNEESLNWTAANRNTMHTCGLGPGN